MVTEFERRFAIRDHPGAVRLLAFLNRVDIGHLRAGLGQSSAASRRGRRPITA